MKQSRSFVLKPFLLIPLYTIYILILIFCLDNDQNNKKPIIKQEAKPTTATVETPVTNKPNPQEKDPDHEEISVDIKKLHDVAKEEYDAMKNSKSEDLTQTSGGPVEPITVVDIDPAKKAGDESNPIKQEEPTKPADTEVTVSAGGNLLTEDNPSQKSPAEPIKEDISGVVVPDGKPIPECEPPKTPPSRKSSTSSSSSSASSSSSSDEKDPRSKLNLNLAKPVLETNFGETTSPSYASVVRSPSQRSEISINISKTCELKSPDLVSQAAKPNGKYSNYFVSISLTFAKCNCTYYSVQTRLYLNIHQHKCFF